MPLSSPTRTICATIGGMRRLRCSDCDMDSPACIRSRAERTASPITRFPSAPATTPSPSSIGPPLRMSTAMARPNRDNESLETSDPTIGTLSITASIIRWPISLLRRTTMPMPSPTAKSIPAHQKCRKILLARITMTVTIGSWTLKEAKMVMKTGTTKAMAPMATRVVNAPTTTGYVAAVFTFCVRSSSRSR